MPQEGSKSKRSSFRCTWYRPRRSEPTNFRQCWAQSQRVAEAFLSAAILEIPPKTTVCWARSRVVKSPVLEGKIYLLWKVFQFPSTSHRQSVALRKGEFSGDCRSLRRDMVLLICYRAQHTWHLYVSDYSHNLLKSEKPFPPLFH